MKRDRWGTYCILNRRKTNHFSYGANLSGNVKCTRKPTWVIANRWQIAGISLRFDSCKENTASQLSMSTPALIYFIIKRIHKFTNLGIKCGCNWLDEFYKDLKEWQFSFLTWSAMKLESLLFFSMSVSDPLLLPNISLTHSQFIPPLSNIKRTMWMQIKYKGFK